MGLEDPGRRSSILIAAWLVTLFGVPLTFGATLALGPVVLVLTVWEVVHRHRRSTPVDGRLRAVMALAVFFGLIAVLTLIDLAMQ